MKKIIGFILVSMIFFTFVACDTPSPYDNFDDLRQRIMDLEKQNEQQADKIEELEDESLVLKNEIEELEEEKLVLKNEIEELELRKDFVLAISTETTTVINDKEFEVNYTLLNISDQAHLIAIWGWWSPSIPGMDKLFASELPEEPRFVLLKAGDAIQGSFILNDYYEFFEYMPGIYELTYLAHFYLNFDPLDRETWFYNGENSVDLRSNKIMITI